MATPAQALECYRRWYSVYVQRRGGAPPPPLSPTQVAAALTRGYSVMHVPLAEGVQPGTLRDGVRLLAHPVTAVFVLRDNLKADTMIVLMRVARAADDGGRPAPDRANLDLISSATAPSQVVLRHLVEYGAKHRTLARHLELIWFLTDVSRHAHVRAAEHYLPEPAELNEYFQHTLTLPSALSRLSVVDPQCVWLGARAGDVVGVREVTANTATVNYYQVVAMRLGLRGLKHQPE